MEKTSYAPHQDYKHLLFNSLFNVIFMVATGSCNFILYKTRKRLRKIKTTCEPSTHVRVPIVHTALSKETRTCKHTNI